MALRTSTSTRIMPLALIIISGFFANVGNGIATVALPLLVLQETGSAASASLVAAAASLPLLASTLLSGTLVDRFGRKTTSLIADLLSGLTVLAIPLIGLTVGLNVGLLAGLAALGAVFDPAGATARETMLPEAAEVSGVRLDRVNSFFEAMYNVSFLVGPGLGGLLVALIGAERTLFVTAAGFALAVVTTAAIRLGRNSRPVQPVQRASFWSSTREGLAFVAKSKLLLAIALLNTVAVGVWMPIQGIILPVHFTASDQAGQIGWVITSVSAGALIGSLAYGQWSNRVTRRHLYILSAVGFAATTVGLAFLPSVGWMVALGAVMGLTYGPQAPIANYAMQTGSPEALRGRITGAMSSIAYAAGPLGFLLAGLLIEGVGIQVTLFIMAGVLVLAAVATARTPALKALDAVDVSANSVRTGIAEALHLPEVRPQAPATTAAR